MFAEPPPLSGRLQTRLQGCRAAGEGYKRVCKLAGLPGKVTNVFASLPGCRGRLQTRLQGSLFLSFHFVYVILSPNNLRPNKLIMTKPPLVGTLGSSVHATGIQLETPSGLSGRTSRASLRVAAFVIIDLFVRSTLGLSMTFLGVREWEQRAYLWLADQSEFLSASRDPNC